MVSFVMFTLKKFLILSLGILFIGVHYYILTLEGNNHERSISETLSPIEQLHELNAKWYEISKENKQIIISRIVEHLDRESRVQIQRRYLDELSPSEKDQAYHFYYNLLDDCAHGRDNPNYMPNIAPPVENPCYEGADCWYAWQYEEQCGEILDIYFPHCFFDVSLISKVSCLSSKQKVYRDPQRWNPNLKFQEKYVLMNIE